MRKVSILVFLAFLLLVSCSKDRNKLLFSGQVYSPNESKNLSGITVELRAQLIESGTYNSNYQLLQKVTTDGGGKYSITNDNVRASSFKITAYSDNYIPSETTISSDLVSVGETYQKNFNIYPKAYLNIYVKNVAPANSTDEITISVIHSSPDCDICSDISNLVLKGDTINDTLICLVYGNQTITVNYTLNTNSGVSQHSHDEYCPAFETKEFSINY